jgi:WD40 repeat protein
MSTAPADASWTAAIHEGERSSSAVGTGVVVAERLVLTCAHVAHVDGSLRADLWISFPKSGEAFWVRRRVARCLHNGLPEHNIDLALLELAEPVPARVRPARLRCLPESALLHRGWWAFGFPREFSGDGSTAHGRVTEGLSWGKVQLTNESEAGLAKGFSGAALWSPDYEAVVGIVEQHNQNGHGRALTFRYADEHLPRIRLASLAAWRAGDAGDAALAAWGWTLTDDGEAGQHWLPRARGVAVRSERGFRFRGRTAALSALRDWLDRPSATGRPLVLTGSPGVGKSAVLGRIVTTADPEIGPVLPADDTAVRATLGSVSCAIHAKGKSALDVAVEIAQAAGARLPQAPDELPSGLRDHLAGRNARFNLIVDALDEAASPQQARLLLTAVLLPLARACDTVGVQVAVGTRRSDDLGSLLEMFGSCPERDVIDLDEAAYFAESDLVAYARATLQLVGDERAGNPYADSASALPLARRIAVLAQANFLVAGLLARTRARNDTVAVDPAEVHFAGGVGAAMDTYVDTLPSAGSVSARCALTVLAFAETPGLPLPLWQAGILAMGGEVTERALAAFARTSAANFLVETGGAQEVRYRLFHQALNDELRAVRDDQTRDEGRLTDAWIAVGSADWAHASDYLRTHLAGHAARTGRLDRLLCDDGYLLHARLDRVAHVAAHVTGSRARSRTQLLQLVPAAIGATPPERAALFTVADTLDRLECGIATEAVRDAPYRARWAHAVPRQERALLEGHADAVFDVCPVTVDGRTFLASGGEDGTTRLWDPRTNQAEQAWTCHADGVRGLCSVRAGNTTLLATASLDSTIRLWDPLSQMLVRELRSHGGWVRNVCTIPLPEGELLASASDDGTVRIWNAATGAPVHTLDGHAGWVTAVTHVPSEGGDLLASAGWDGTVRLWDPLTGTPTAKMTGHENWVRTLCAVRLDRARAVIASAGYDGTVRLWDPRTHEQVGEFDIPGPVTDLCTVDTSGGRLLAATGEDGVIRLWNVADWSERQPLTGHSSWIRAVCELPTDDGRVLATAGDDGTVRLWDPDAPRRGPIADARQLRAVTSLCAFSWNGTQLVASAGGDENVRLWDPVTGDELHQLNTETDSVTSVCVADDDGPVLVVAGNRNGDVELWDDPSAPPREPMDEHYESVNALCTIHDGDTDLVASAGEDQTVRLWTVHDRVVRQRLAGHSEWVTALAVVSRQGRPALASADKTGTVRLWDPDGTQHWTFPGHQLRSVDALCAVTVDDHELLVSAGADRSITLWEPDDGRPIAKLLGHEREVTGVCRMSYAGRDVIVSTSLDRTVRLWDPATERLIRTIQVYHPALSGVVVGDILVVGLDKGLLALQIGPGDAD